MTRFIISEIGEFILEHSSTSWLKSFFADSTGWPKK